MSSIGVLRIITRHPCGPLTKIN